MHQLIVAHRKSKLLFFMAVGSLAMALGSVVATNSRFGSNISPTTFATSIIVSAALFFIGGLFWVIVAAALRKLD